MGNELRKSMKPGDLRILEAGHVASAEQGELFNRLGHPIIHVPDNFAVIVVALGTLITDNGGYCYRKVLVMSPIGALWTWDSYLTKPE